MSALPSVLVLERTNRTTARLDRVLSPALRKNLLAWAAVEHAPLRFVELSARMSIAAQARLFRSAAVIISNHGAACSNVVFCQPGTHFIELRPVFIPCYYHLARRAGLHYHVETQESAVERLAQIWRTRNQSSRCPTCVAASDGVDTASLLSPRARVLPGGAVAVTSLAQEQASLRGWRLLACVVILPYCFFTCIRRLARLT